MPLSAEQIAFFKHNGYLLVSGAMDLALCARARDAMWAALPDHVRLRRDDPATHVGPFAENEQSHDSLHVRNGYLWQLRAIGTSRTLLDLIYSRSITAMAQQLLGGTLREPVTDGTPMGSRGPAWPGGPTDPADENEGARGVYFTLPYGERPRQPDRAHTDGHPFQLGVVGLLDDIEPDGGAFKVWPRSHARLYPTFQLQYDQPRIPYYDHLPTLKGIVHTPAYLEELEKMHSDTSPVDCWGSAGDIVFWHHRTAHMAGQNYSQRIRQAVLADFSTTALDEARTRPPEADMWHDWSEAMRASTGAYSTEFALAQRLTLPLYADAAKHAHSA